MLMRIVSFDRAALEVAAADLFALARSCMCISQVCTTSYMAEKKITAQQQLHKLASCLMAHAFTGNNHSKALTTINHLHFAMPCCQLDVCTVLYA
jgi:hypothetical protein